MTNWARRNAAKERYWNGLVEYNHSRKRGDVRTFSRADRNRRRRGVQARNMRGRPIRPLKTVSLTDVFKAVYPEELILGIRSPAS